MQVDDTLHTMALGVEQRYSGTVLTTILEHNAFGFEGGTKENRHKLGIKELRRRIRTYYSTMARDNPHYDISRIDKLTLSMLGDLIMPCLKAKGGESSDLTCFATQLAGEFKHLDATLVHLTNAGAALIRVKTSMHTSQRKVHHNILVDSMDNAKRFVLYYRLGGGHMVPKFHRFLHLVRNMIWFGNPKYYSTWYDEHENGMIKKIAMAAHSLRFVEGTFERIMCREHIDAKRLRLS